MSGAAALPRYEPRALTPSLELPRVTRTAPQPGPSPTATRPAFPSRVSPPSVQGLRSIIGYSVKGNPLEMVRFGRGLKGKLIIAGIHGGYEWNTSALAEELIQYLKENPALVPTRQALYILPVLNIDGALREHGPHGRANTHNVDLNRNWDANWKADWRRDYCWNLLPITAGAGPASEPETQALMNFIDSHPIEAVISYHSAGGEVYAGGQPGDSPSRSLARTIAAASGYDYPGHNISCEYTGQFIDWAALRHIPAADVELTNHLNTDIKTNLQVLRAFLDWKP